MRLKGHTRHCQIYIRSTLRVENNSLDFTLQNYNHADYFFPNLTKLNNVLIRFNIDLYRQKKKTINPLHIFIFYFRICH